MTKHKSSGYYQKSMRLIEVTPCVMTQNITQGQKKIYNDKRTSLLKQPRLRLNKRLIRLSLDHQLVVLERLLCKTVLS